MFPMSIRIDGLCFRSAASTATFPGDKMGTGEPIHSYQIPR